MWNITSVWVRLHQCAQYQPSVPSPVSGRVRRVCAHLSVSVCCLPIRTVREWKKWEDERKTQWWKKCCDSVGWGLEMISTSTHTHTLMFNIHKQHLEQITPAHFPSHTQVTLTNHTVCDPSLWARSQQTAGLCLSQWHTGQQQYWIIELCGRVFLVDFILYCSAMLWRFAQLYSRFGCHVTEQPCDHRCVYPCFPPVVTTHNPFLQ